MRTNLLQMIDEYKHDGLRDYIQAQLVNRASIICHRPDGVVSTSNNGESAWRHLKARYFTFYVRRVDTSVQSIVAWSENLAWRLLPANVDRADAWCNEDARLAAEAKQWSPINDFIDTEPDSREDCLSAAGMERICLLRQQLHQAVQSSCDVRWMEQALKSYRSATALPDLASHVPRLDIEKHQHPPRAWNKAEELPLTSEVLPKRKRVQSQKEQMRISAILNLNGVPLPKP